ncbi:MAG: FAD-dependent oxidoreductase [Bdellovibrionia bacterium]
MNRLCFRPVHKVFVLLVIMIPMLQSEGSWAAPADLNLGIAVLGGGVSGLTAARSLKKSGYKNVTVFEKEDQVGGKVSSIDYDNHHFELGAVWISRDYSVVRDIAKEVGVSFKDYIIPKLIVEPNGKKTEFTKYFLHKHRMRSVLSALMKFNSLKHKYATEWDVGFADVHPDLYENFEAFAIKNKIVPLADLFEPFFVACGYGYYKEVPAIYIMKLMRMMLRVVKHDMLGKFPGVHKAGLLTVEGGFQQIWTKLAATLDVHTGASVTAIRRKIEAGKPIIELTINGETQVFDRVVSSLPLPVLNKILDVSVEEEQLFSKVQGYDYWVTVFHGQDLAKGETLFLQDNIKSESIGRPIVLGNRYTDTDIWVTYQLATKNLGAKELEANLEREIEALGGRVNGVLTQKKWDYFPYVKTEDLQGGFYKNLERMQGLNGFYYVGGIMNFETTEHTAEYAKDLVDHKFD